jgi:hypothetical protein
LEAVEPSLDPYVQQGKGQQLPVLTLPPCSLAGDDTFHGLTILVTYSSSVWSLSSCIT